MFKGGRTNDFYPRSPCGERPPSTSSRCNAWCIFLSTLSLRRATRHWQTGHSLTRHFYPRSPCGERRQPYRWYRVSLAFLSTLSLRRATGGLRAARCATRISIHALLAESDVVHLAQAASPGGISIHALLAESDLPFACWWCCCTAISIHALLAESDDTLIHSTPSLSCISIHALLAESDAVIAVCEAWAKGFLSTLSLRRATRRQCDTVAKAAYFYPRSPCGERRQAYSQARRGYCISIHALLAESDLASQFSLASTQAFLSTLSLRRATSPGVRRQGCGEFLSTLSLRRATAKVHKTVEHFCAYETNFMEIASSC